MTVEYKNVSGHTRLSPYGVIGSKIIPADGILLVVDEAAESYDCQPTIWEPVDTDGFHAREAEREAGHAADEVEPEPSPDPAEVAVLEEKVAEDEAALATAEHVTEPENVTPAQ